MQRYAFCLISNTDHPAPPQPVQRAAYCVTLPVPVHSDHSDIAIGANYVNKNDLEKSIHSNTTLIVAQNLCCIFELLTLKTYIDESIRRDLKTFVVPVDSSDLQNSLKIIGNMSPFDKCPPTSYLSSLLL